MRSDLLRSAAAFLLVSLWMGLLLTGGLLPAAVVHLLLAGALAIFPWRWLRNDHGNAPAEDPPAGAEPPG